MDVVERYLLLGLRIGRHVDGFVDAYYGPPALRERVAGEPPAPPSELAAEAAALGEEAARLDDASRAAWLAAQLDGLAATAERLAGRRLSFVDECRRCYGVVPERASEDELDEAHRRLDALLPGGGDLGARYRRWRAERELSREQVPPALAALTAELRRRTSAVFGLPAGEAVELDVVENEPWAGFNYYLGGLRSRVVVNTDIPPRSEQLPVYAAHEVYPGHHTEHAWKEELLVRGRGRLEESILLTGTPQSLVSEGIAENALAVLGAEAEDACAAVLAELGAAYDVELVRKVREAEKPLRRIPQHLALMLHEGGADRDQGRAFALRWGLRREDEVEKMLEFGSHPTWRAYVVTYDLGARLVETFVAGDPARFRRVLTEQLTTTDLLAE